MGGFVIYQRLPRQEILASAKEEIKNITKWFEDNPKRRVCRAEFWYGVVITIKKGTIKEQVNQAAKDAIGETKTIRFK
jgi:hypothetical protein